MFTDTQENISGCFKGKRSNDGVDESSRTVEIKRIFFGYETWRSYSKAENEGIAKILNFSSSFHHRSFLLF
jgi:hypothetical protein